MVTGEVLNRAKYCEILEFLEGCATTTLVGVVVAFFAITVIFAGIAMKSSEAYKVAINEIEQNQEILGKTGGIKGYGMMPAGSVNISNGMGSAQLEIKVEGNKMDLNVSVYLTKQPDGEWEIIELYH